MKVYLSHETALRYWRMHFPLDTEPGNWVRMNAVEEYAYRKDDVIGCTPEWLIDPDEPLNVLVFDAAKRRVSQSVNCTLWGTVVPDDAFFRLGNAFVSSPEFLFLQMASRLSVVKLVALGCELCGLYVPLPKGVLRPDTLDQNPTRICPLTDAGRLRAFAERAVGAKGRKNALRALRFIVDGSRSPMETRTFMQLCLSPMLGGYGFPLPQMNLEIPLDEEGRVIARQQTAFGDICWSEKQLDIEYHGDVHVGSAQMKHDVGRILGIEHMGWKVITVTSSQVLDIDRFDVVAQQAASRLGRQLPSRVAGDTPARRMLHDELDSWMLG